MGPGLRHPKFADIFNPAAHRLDESEFLTLRNEWQTRESQQVWLLEYTLVQVGATGGTARDDLLTTPLLSPNGKPVQPHKHTLRGWRECREGS